MSIYEEVSEETSKNSLYVGRWTSTAYVLSSNDRGRFIQRDCHLQLSIQLNRRGERNLKRQGLASRTVIDDRIRGWMESKNSQQRRMWIFPGVNCVHGLRENTSLHHIALRCAPWTAPYAPEGNTSVRRHLCKFMPFHDTSTMTI